MGMGMEPLPMGGTMGGNMDMDLSILSAEEHGDLKILEERERIRRMQASQHEYQMGGRRGDDLKGRGAGVGRGRKRAGSDDSGHDPTPVARGGPGGSSNRKQRGRPRLDTKDENAADVCIYLPPPLLTLPTAFVSNRRNCSVGVLRSGSLNELTVFARRLRYRLYAIESTS